MEKDLRTYLERVARSGELLCVEQEVDPREEGPALIKRAIAEGKVLLLQKIKGTSIPTLGNTPGSRALLAQTFGKKKEELVSHFADVASRPLRTRRVTDAAAKEVLEKEVNLLALPLLILHEKDAGPYITGGIGIQRDPETGKQNAGYYSLQVKGKDRLGLRMLPNNHGYRIFERRRQFGRRTEMAVAIGVHPVEMLAASTNTLEDELELAGGLRGEPLEVVPCETIDVEVPAHSEIVLEGTILPDCTEPEGPLGDWLGYYARPEERHVLKIEKVTHRSEPIFQTVLSGSPEENLLLALPREAQVLRAAQRVVPNVTNVSLDPFMPICIVQLKKRFEGEPMNAMLAAIGQVPFIKVCVAVDEDVDLYNLQDVLWAVVTRTQLEQDLNVIKNVMGFSRDPYKRFTSKLVIDATFPLEHVEHFTRTRVVNENIDLHSYARRP